MRNRFSPRLEQLEQRENCSRLLPEPYPQKDIYLRKFDNVYDAGLSVYSAINGLCFQLNQDAARFGAGAVHEVEMQTGHMGGSGMVWTTLDAIQLTGISSTGTFGNLARGETELWDRYIRLQDEWTAPDGSFGSTGWFQFDLGPLPAVNVLYCDKNAFFQNHGDGFTVFLAAAARNGYSTAWEMHLQVLVGAVWTDVPVAAETVAGACQHYSEFVFDWDTDWEDENHNLWFRYEFDNGVDPDLHSATFGVSPT